MSTQCDAIVFPEGIELEEIEDMEGAQGPPPLTEKERQEKEQQVKDFLNESKIREAEEIIDELANRNAPVSLKTYTKLLKLISQLFETNFPKSVDKYINQISQMRMNVDDYLMSITLYL
jgi:hypothetical protein